VFLLAIPVAAAAVLIRAATSDPSVAVEENYYERGLAWDEEARQRAANQRLGWGFELLAGRAGGERLLLQARLLNAEGAPVAADRVRIEAFAVARAADRLQLEPVLAGDGSWEAASPLPRGGLWEFRLEALAGDERFTEVLRRDLGGTGGRP
jgi:nitrogen fixation protein FixH